MRRPNLPGSALFAATLLATLLATAAAALISHVQAARMSTAESVKLRQAKLSAEAIVAETLTALDRPGAHVALNGERAALENDHDDGAWASVQDTAGLIDLNAAPPDRLAALFVALGVAKDRAAQLADHVADWRDGDDLKRLFGAERDEYEAAGLAGPANAPFETEEQLAKVLGISEALARCALSYVTVFSGAPDADYSVAPSFVHGARPGAASPLANDLTPFGHVLVVAGYAPLSPSAAVRVRQWVRLTGDEREPLMVHRGDVAFVPISAAAPQTCDAQNRAKQSP